MEEMVLVLEKFNKLLLPPLPPLPPLQMVVVAMEIGVVSEKFGAGVWLIVYLLVLMDVVVLSLFVKVLRSIQQPKHLPFSLSLFRSFSPSLLFLSSMATTISFAKSSLS